jgi:hypothetical protein
MSIESISKKLSRDLQDSKTFAENVSNTLRDQLGKERLDREGHCQSVANSISGVEQRCREEVLGRLEDHRSIFYQLKEDVTKTLASESSTRDEARRSTASSMEALEAKLRREIADDTSIRDAIRESISQERQLREKALRAVSSSIADVERKLAADLAQASTKREVGVAELRDLIKDSCAKEGGRCQELLTKEIASRLQFEEAVQKQLSQERAARDVQQETLRVYLAQDRGQREAPLQAIRERIESLVSTSLVSRVEFDSSLRRVWETLETHSGKLDTVLNQPARVVTPVSGCTERQAWMVKSWVPTTTTVQKKMSSLSVEPGTEVIASRSPATVHRTISPMRACDAGLERQILENTIIEPLTFESRTTALIDTRSATAPATGLM